MRRGNEGEGHYAPKREGGAVGPSVAKGLLPQLLNENIRAVAAACRAAATLTFPCADRTVASASTRRAPH